MNLFGPYPEGIWFTMLELRKSIKFMQSEPLRYQEAIERETELLNYFIGKPYQCAA